MSWLFTVELLRKNFEKIVVDMPTHETEAVTHILSLEKKGEFKSLTVFLLLPLFATI